MRRLVLGVFLGVGWTLVPACEPDQPEVTTTCAVLADCPLGYACDPSTKQCTDALVDRFVGTFACRPVLPSDDPNFLDTYAQVTGQVAGAGFTLTRAICTVLDTDSDPSTPPHLGVELTPSSGSQQSLSILISGEKLSTANIALRPHVGTGFESAKFEDQIIKRRYGTSDTGTFKIVSGTPARGELVTVDLDVKMLAVESEDPHFGRPCPRGLAQCGSLLQPYGGVDYCIEVLESDTEPVCVRNCLSDSDCGPVGVSCVGNYCAYPCLLDSDCPAPTVCTQLVPGGPKGCL